jgi:hypothetical protein
VPRKSKKLVLKLAQWLGPWLIRLLGWSLRIKTVNAAPVETLLKEGKPFLFSLWHGHMLVPIYHHRNQGIVPMISQHGDGEMIARIVKRLGYGAVRGSSKRGGREAFHELLNHLQEGGVGAMLPDGPTGPRYHLKPGTLLLASRAGCPLVPITFAAKKCWRLNSWDRFIVPKPFSRCVIVYGDPIEIPAELSEEEVEIHRAGVEKKMMELVRSAEVEYGRSGDDD